MKRFVYVLAVAVLLGVPASNAQQQQQQSALGAMSDIYHTCLKDFDIGCAKPKAMRWLNEVANQDEILITGKLSIVRTGSLERQRALNSQEQLFDDMDGFVNTHALRIQAPDFFRSAEARAYVPEFLADNALTKGALVPLGTPSEGRGIIRKAILPFLLGLKLKTFVLVPLVLSLIALKTWKAMTLGLLSLVLSGALVIFKIAKPKIVNYELVHYPPPHVEHVVPHHIEHVIPHHVDRHVEHHIDVPHHVDHLEHPAPSWDPHAWSRSSVQEPQDAQNMAYAGQRRR